MLAAELLSAALAMDELAVVLTAELLTAMLEAELQAAMPTAELTAGLQTLAAAASVLHDAGWSGVAALPRWLAETGRELPFLKPPSPHLPPHGRLRRGHSRPRLVGW